MASNYGNPFEDGVTRAKPRLSGPREVAREMLVKSTKASLVSDVEAIAKRLKITFRDALIYAESGYTGPLTDTVVITEFLAEKAHGDWSRVLGAAVRTINRPDRILLTHNEECRLTTTAGLLGEVRRAAKISFKNSGGNGFHGGRSFLSSTYMTTNLCMSCRNGSNFGANLLDDPDRGIGALWFNSHLPDTKAQLRTAIANEGFILPNMIDQYIEIAGICSNCRHLCNRCNGPVNLNYDMVELGILREEGTCRACARFNLAFVPAPKFGRQDLRKMHDKLSTLKGGNSE